MTARIVKGLHVKPAGVCDVALCDAHAKVWVEVDVGDTKELAQFCNRHAHEAVR